MSVVTISGLVLDVSDVDGNTALFFFRSGINLLEIVCRVEIRIFLMQNLGNSGSQSCLTVINVTDCTDVNVRLGALVLGLCHICPPGRLVADLNLLNFRRHIHFRILPNYWGISNFVSDPG